MDVWTADCEAPMAEHIHIQIHSLTADLQPGCLCKVAKQEAESKKKKKDTWANANWALPVEESSLFMEVSLLVTVDLK